MSEKLTNPSLAADVVVPSQVGSSKPMSAVSQPVDDEIEILAVIKLPLPMNGFIGLLKGMKLDFGRGAFIRNSPDGYEVFRTRRKITRQQPGGSLKHDKDCQLGDNWKDCPACREQEKASR